MEVADTIKSLTDKQNRTAAYKSRSSEFIKNLLVSKQVHYPLNVST